MNSHVKSPSIKNAKSVREQVGEAEWETRVNLAAFYRLVALNGWSEGTANHISARAPGRDHEFLINPYGLLYEEVDASNLIRVDLDGEITFNATDYGVNRAGFVIHSTVHAARPDFACVAHTHTIAGMAVSAMKCGLLPLAQSSMRVARIAYHDFEGIAENDGERERLVADLGDHTVMILRNHGLLACGNTIDQTWFRLFALERACQTQIAAMAANTELVIPPKDIVDMTWRNLQPRPDRWNSVTNLGWESLKRKLDRIDPSYKD